MVSGFQWSQHSISSIQHRPRPSELKAIIYRRRHFLIAVLCFFGLSAGLYRYRNHAPQSVLQIIDKRPPGPEPGPPSWERLKKWEKELPQHNLDLPSPEGRTGRYIKFSNQIARLGWNNVLAEMHLNAYLAYESKRAFVFPDYVWEPAHYPWLERQSARGSPWPPRTPLNALLSGPISGGSWDDDDNSPRSISDTFFRDACPQHKTRIITTDEIKPAILWESGVVVFEAWKKVLLEAPERCIEVREGHGQDSGPFPQTFDVFLLGSPRVVSLWEKFVQSPVSRLTRSSPIVESAVARNEYIFLPKGPRPPVPVPRNPYDRMLAMHVRRGDYSSSCSHYAKWSSTFFGWNQLEFLPDHFVPPEGSSWGENTPENTEIYLRKCLPSIEQMVARTRQIRQEYSHTKNGTRLDVLYLLTNEKGEWLDELRKAMTNEGFATIRTSRDLQLDQEQMEVNGAVDSEIARRAAVFIGNGWSSYTSNIVHGRLVDGKDPLSIRFY